MQLERKRRWASLPPMGARTHFMDASPSATPPQENGVSSELRASQSCADAAAAPWVDSLEPIRTAWVHDDSHTTSITSGSRGEDARSQRVGSSSSATSGCNDACSLRMGPRLSRVDGGSFSLHSGDYQAPLAHNDAKEVEGSSMWSYHGSLRTNALHPSLSGVVAGRPTSVGTFSGMDDVPSTEESESPASPSWGHSRFLSTTHVYVEDPSSPMGLRRAIQPLRAPSHSCYNAPMVPTTDLLPSPPRNRLMEEEINVPMEHAPPQAIVATPTSSSPTSPLVACVPHATTTTTTASAGGAAAASSSIVDQLVSLSVQGMEDEAAENMQATSLLSSPISTNNNPASSNTHLCVSFLSLTQVDLLLHSPRLESDSTSYGTTTQLPQLRQSRCVCAGMELSIGGGECELCGGRLARNSPTPPQQQHGHAHLPHLLAVDGSACCPSPNAASAMGGRPPWTRSSAFNKLREEKRNWAFAPFASGRLRSNPSSTPSSPTTTGNRSLEHFRGSCGCGVGSIRSPSTSRQQPSSHSRVRSMEESEQQVWMSKVGVRRRRQNAAAAAPRTTNSVSSACKAERHSPSLSHGSFGMRVCASPSSMSLQSMEQQNAADDSAEWA